jgi:hypothetical protein
MNDTERQGFIARLRKCEDIVMSGLTENGKMFTNIEANRILTLLKEARTRLEAKK